MAHLQVYNHYMAKELIALHKQVRSDKWELLHEMSSLERQLEASKAQRKLERGRPANGHDGAAEGEGEGGFDELGLPQVVTEASRLEELAALQATLAEQRAEVGACMEAMAAEQVELGAALKQAAEEAAATRGAEAARAAQAENRQRELQVATKELEEKIGAIKAAAKLGAERTLEQVRVGAPLSLTRASHTRAKPLGLHPGKATPGQATLGDGHPLFTAPCSQRRPCSHLPSCLLPQSSVAELSELEAIVLAAEEDVGRIEQRLSEPAGGGLSTNELEELASSLRSRLAALERDGDVDAALARVAARKDAAMAEVASQLVPHMNALQVRPLTAYAHVCPLSLLPRPSLSSSPPCRS